MVELTWFGTITLINYNPNLITTFSWNNLWLPFFSCGKLFLVPILALCLFVQTCVSFLESTATSSNPFHGQFQNYTNKNVNAQVTASPPHPRDYVNNRLLGKDSIEYWQNGQTGARETRRGRGLINEYFSRTRTPQEPPPIFRSTNGRPLSGYFPLPTTRTVHSSPVDDDMDLEQVLNFVDENFREIGVSSVIVPEKKVKTQNAKTSKVRKSESCHLIGKVNPNILRTWEQLNRNDDDVDGHQREDFEERNNFQDFCEELAPFKVNYVTYDQKRRGRRGRSHENLFYDSID